jgi:hypothetical protein
MPTLQAKKVYVSFIKFGFSLCGESGKNTGPPVPLLGKSKQQCRVFYYAAVLKRPISFLGA